MSEQASAPIGIRRICKEKFVAVAVRKLTVAVLIGVLLMAHGRGCFAQDSMKATIGHTTFTLIPDLRPRVYTNRVTGDVAISIVLTTQFLGFSFPKANGHVRGTVFVTLRTGAVYKTLLEGYHWAIRGRPLRQFGRYSVYEIDPAQELYVGDRFSDPPAFKCEAELPGVLAGMIRGCDVREYLLPPATPALRQDAVVVDYGLSYGELSVLATLDKRIMDILRNAANISDL